MSERIISCIIVTVSLSSLASLARAESERLKSPDVSSRVEVSIAAAEVTDQKLTPQRNLRVTYLLQTKKKQSIKTSRLDTSLSPRLQSDQRRLNSLRRRRRAQLHRKKSTEDPWVARQEEQFRGPDKIGF